MQKQILRESEVRERVSKAVDKICAPVIETIGPEGKDVLFESENGTFVLTRDGITIVRSIELDDAVEKAVGEIIKDGALSTNQQAGDSTSTTVLWTRELVKKAEALRDSGVSARDVKKILQSVQDKLLKRLDKFKRQVKDDKTKKSIALISANGDDEIASNVLDTIKIAGLDGLVYLDMSGNEKTRLEKQEGYRISEGMKYQNLYTDPGKPQVVYQDIPVIIFDKTLYYEEEADHILRTAQDLGFKSLCIVAKEYQGDAPNTLIANHVRGTIKLVLAKLSDDIAIEDLGVYLGGGVVSESGGRRVDSINRNDFTVARTITCDPTKILFTNEKENKFLKARVAHLQEELEKDKDAQHIKTRLASLTNGIVTLKIGGRTEKEAREKAFRYEDAINATRAAMRDGFLVGGGLSMYEAFDTRDYDSEDEVDIALTLSQSSMKQIARNAQVKLDWKKVGGNTGLNARTGQYENLFESGVVEPFKATEMALKNAVSCATIISSIGTYILNDYGRNKNCTCAGNDGGTTPDKGRDGAHQ